MAIDFAVIPSPCYVLDEQRLRRNLEVLHHAAEATGARIICALKGYAMFSTFPMVRRYLSGAAASSLYEARLSLEEMQSRAHLCAPAYREDEFDDLLRLCSHITFNSLDQWERFRGRIRESSEPVRCGLRINPEHSEVATDLYNPARPGSRLGIRRDGLPDTLPGGISGLHFHSLCENDSHALERTLAAVEDRFAPLIGQCSWINFGGGHLITSGGYDVPHLIGLILSFRDRYGGIEVILEPGAAVGWEAGYLVSTVQDIVETGDGKTAILDVSFTSHMPDTLEMPYKPRIVGATDPVEGRPSYCMGGISCLAGDCMGDYSFDRPLAIGDRVVFEDMIHYTMVKTTTFNGVGLPSIGIWTEAGNFRLVRAFGYDDFRNRLS